jgi:hypothetical protein
MTDSELRKLGEETAIEMADIAIDQLLDDDLLKELPFIEWGVKAARVTRMIRDRLFLRKVMSFVNNLRTPSAKRQEFRDKLAGDPKLRKKLGEVLLIHLDHLNDLDKPEYTARMYDAMLAGQIAFAQFRKLIDAIDLAYIEDLHALANGTDLDNSEMASLVRTGLVDIVLEGAGMHFGDFTAMPPLRYKISTLGTLFSNIAKDES